MNETIQLLCDDIATRTHRASNTSPRKTKPRVALLVQGKGHTGQVQKRG